jgi:pimeloyl-ACP methyl ester carboxylesterase
MATDFVPLPSQAKWQENIIPFQAGDGFQCNLHHVQGPSAPTRNPVLLVHGAGVRANIFRAPVDATLVDLLVENGYDVWLENWRASIDLPATEWTLDDAAVMDHPAAVRVIRERTGSDDISAVIHCQGSTSFMMSAVAGLLPEVKTIVTNAVSLHTVVPDFSQFKLKVLIPLIKSFYPFLDPQWGLKAPDLRAQALVQLVKLTHHECNNIVCKFSSFTYGTGFPVLWRHENLNDETHEWLKGEFAKVPLTFFSQMAQCVRQGNLVSLGKYRQLPANFCTQPPQTDARFVFVTGDRNICFLPESQRRSFDFLEQFHKGFHSMHTFPGYGHLDVFMGKNAFRDTFPIIMKELDRGSAGVH